MGERSPLNTFFISRARVSAVCDLLSPIASAMSWTLGGVLFGLVGLDFSSLVSLLLIPLGDFGVELGGCLPSRLNVPSFVDRLPMRLQIRRIRITSVQPETLGTIGRDKCDDST